MARDRGEVGGGARERVGGRADHPQLVFGIRLEHEVVRCGEVGDQAALGLSAAHGLQHARLVADDHGRRQSGEPAAQQRERGRQRVGHEALAARDREMAALGVRRGVDRDGRLLGDAHDLERAGKQRSARLRQRDGTAAAVEERRSHAPLECCHERRDRRLARAERLSGAREARRVRNADEGAKPGRIGQPIHGVSLCRSDWNVDSR